MPLIKESQNYERGGTQKDEYLPEDVVVVLCPLCGGNNRKQLYTEHQVIGIVQCLSCSLIYTCPRLKAPEAIYWGDAEEYYAEARLIFEGKAKHHRDPNYLEELKLIAKYKPSGKFLDVGCNMGMLLRHVLKMGYAAVGIEPSPSLAQLATKYLGITVYNCFLHELFPGNEKLFDVVALSDIFEHICGPLPFLREVERLLAADGLVYIKVPNARWNLLKQKLLVFMGRRPKQGVWDSYEHVIHYTDATLSNMLRKAGLRIIRVTIGKPVQTPVWHQYVGHYYQYPSSWTLDWKRHLGRSAFYWLSWGEHRLRLGSPGYFAPNIVILAKRL